MPPCVLTQSHGNKGGYSAINGIFAKPSYTPAKAIVPGKVPSFPGIFIIFVLPASAIGEKPLRGSSRLRTEARFRALFSALSVCLCSHRKRAGFFAFYAPDGPLSLFSGVPLPEKIAFPDKKRERTFRAKKGEMRR